MAVTNVQYKTQTHTHRIVQFSYAVIGFRSFRFGSIVATRFLASLTLDIKTSKSVGETLNWCANK